MNKSNLYKYISSVGARDIVVVKALFYKPEGLIPDEVIF
jgi:hypothetical protein